MIRLHATDDACGSTTIHIDRYFPITYRTNPRDPTALLSRTVAGGSSIFHQAGTARKCLTTAMPCTNSETVSIMFSHIKDWRRITMHDDRWAHTFCSANRFPAIFIFYFNE